MTDTVLDHGATVIDLYRIALTHRHSAVRETAMALHYDMTRCALPDVQVVRRYTELQAMIAQCRRYDRDQARRRRRAEWWWALRIVAMCAVVAAASVIAAVLS